MRPVLIPIKSRRLIVAKVRFIVGFIVRIITPFSLWHIVFAWEGFLLPIAVKNGLSNGVMIYILMRMKRNEVSKDVEKTECLLKMDNKIDNRCLIKYNKEL